MNVIKSFGKGSVGLRDKGDHSFSLQCHPVPQIPGTRLQTPQLKAAAWRCTPVKPAQCPAHPVLSPQTFITSSCVPTLLYTYSVQVKEEGQGEGREKGQSKGRRKRAEAKGKQEQKNRNRNGKEGQECQRLACILVLLELGSSAQGQLLHRCPALHQTASMGACPIVIQELLLSTGLSPCPCLSLQPCLYPVTHPTRTLTLTHGLDFLT